MVVPPATGDALVTIVLVTGAASGIVTVYSFDTTAPVVSEASTVKVYASEFFVEAYRSMMEIFGAAGKLRARSPGAILAGRVERMYRSARILTFGGGTNEVQRDIIAMAGLQMPNYKA